MLVYAVGKLLVGQAQGKLVFFGNYSVVRIAGTSMQNDQDPQRGIDFGEYILVQKTSPSNVKMDDVITFYSVDKDIYGKPNTHRVVGIEQVDGKYLFTTRGDHNPFNDLDKVEEKYLAGVVVTKLKVVTKIVNFLTSGFLFVIIALVCLITIVSAVVAKKAEQKKANEQLLVQQELEKIKQQAKDGTLDLTKYK